MSTGSCGAQLAAAANCACYGQLHTHRGFCSCNPKCGPESWIQLTCRPEHPKPSHSPEHRLSLPAGQVTATNNPQVALYTMTLPFPGKHDRELRQRHDLWDEDMGAVDDGKRRPGKYFCCRDAGQHHLPYAGRHPVYQRYQCHRYRPHLYDAGGAGQHAAKADGHHGSRNDAATGSRDA